MYSSYEDQIYSNVIGSAERSAQHLIDRAINLGASLDLKNPQQVRVNVDPSSPDRQAEHDLADAQAMHKEGMNFQDIKIEIMNSRVAKEADNPDLYATCITEYAERRNILEQAPPLESNIERSQDLQL